MSNTGLPPGVSGTSAEARRFRDVMDELHRELGELTPAEELQARSIATITLALDRLQAELLRGELADSEALTRLANVQARALSAIKRGRSARKPVGVSKIDAFLAAQPKPEG